MTASASAGADTQRDSFAVPARTLTRPRSVRRWELSIPSAEVAARLCESEFESEFAVVSEIDSEPESEFVFESESASWSRFESWFESWFESELLSWVALKGVCAHAG